MIAVNDKKYTIYIKIIKNQNVTKIIFLVTF